jgi:hypothetical protein
MGDVGHGVTLRVRIADEPLRRVRWLQSRTSDANSGAVVSAANSDGSTIQAGQVRTISGNIHPEVQIPLLSRLTESGPFEGTNGGSIWTGPQ